MSESRYIFLSYRSTEADFALKLAADLKNAGVNLWMDRLDISPGDDWRKSLESAVYSCAALIAILSPSYVSSKYCQRELARADRLGRPIFPVLLGSIGESDWPLEIERQQYIDFSNWQDQRHYQTQLNRLVDILKEKFAAQISVIPDPETQYLTNLAADMETQRGLIEYLEFSTDADKWLNRELIRPEPRSIKFWTGHANFALLQFPPGNTYQAYRKRLFIEIDAILEKHPRIVLVGAPGSGKTTTLRRLILDSIYAHETDGASTALPLSVNLVTWDDQLSLDDFIRTHWPLDTDVMKLLARGEIALYIDGLNEMSGARQEKALMLREWLASDNGPQRVIITCRTSEYDQSFDMGLPVVQIGEMDYAHIERFATTYLGDDLAQIFLAQILPKSSWDERHKQHLHQIARNPFLLSAMILMHKSSPHGEVPDNLGVLMHQLVSEIWEREHNNPGTPQASFEELRTALADLAYTMIDEDLGLYIPYSYALENIGSDLLLKLAHKMQMIEIRAGNVRFSQQMFQDYFAALALGRKGLAEHLHEPRIYTGGRYSAGKWDQGMVMYCGIAANTDETLLEIARHNPFLALECISSGINASDRTVDPIIGNLIRIANTPDSDARVATASILARIDQNLAIPILLEAMRDGTWEVRWAATLTLQEIDIALLPGLTDVLWELEHDIQDAAEVAVRQLGSDALPTLLKLLQSDNWKMRRGAAWALGRVQDRAALPGLVQALHDEDNLVSAEAAASLGQIKDEAGIKWLVETLQHPNWRVRRAAAQALGAAGKPALGALTEALKNEHEDVRRLAIEALKESAEPDITDILLGATYDESPEVRGAALDALNGIQDEIIVERLIECLTDTTRTRWNKKRICDIAARILETIDMTEAHSALEQWQKDEVELAPKQKNITSKTTGSKTADRAKERLQRITRQASEDSPPPQSVAEVSAKPKRPSQAKSIQKPQEDRAPTAILHLARALENQEPKVRLAAIEALAAMGTSTAVEILAQGLRDSNPEVVNATTRSLRDSGSLAVPVLSRLLTDRNLAVRTTAIELLGEIGDPAAVPHLKLLLSVTDTPSAKDETISQLSARALRAIGTPEALAAIEAPPTAVQPAAAEPVVAPEAPPAVSGERHEILTDLLTALHQAEWGDREDAAKALREYAKTLRGTRDAQVLQRLTAALHDSDWVIRWAAAEALAWLRDLDAVPALTAVLKDSYWMVRIAVIRALLEIGDRAATTPIAMLLTEPNNKVREAAAEALGVLGDPAAVPYLARALADTEAFVRLSATVALGKINDASVVKPLVQALEDSDSHIRWAAAHALIERGDATAVPELIKHLGSQEGPYWEDQKIGDLATAALEHIGTPDAKAAILQWQSRQVPQQ